MSRDFYRFDLESCSDFIMDDEVRWWLLGWIDAKQPRGLRAPPEGEGPHPPEPDLVRAYEAGIAARNEGRDRDL